MKEPRGLRLATVALATATLVVIWAASTPYPGVGATVPTLTAELVRGSPPPNHTGVPAAGLEHSRDAMGSLWVSATMRGNPREAYHARLYVPEGKAWLRGVSSRIQSTATDETFGIVLWRVTLILAEDLPVQPSDLCLEIRAESADPSLMGNCP